MYNRQNNTVDVTLNQQDIAAQTARWTSPAYDVNFGQIDAVHTDHLQEQSFRLSAWGLSSGLRSLLEDYSDDDIRKAISWLTIQQNAYVAMLLDQVSIAPEWDTTTPTLNQLYFAIDAELFLPRGLRMVVTCVTNIVASSDGELDKFVAVLDPGEAYLYVQERRGMDLNHTITRIQ